MGVNPNTPEEVLQRVDHLTNTRIQMAEHETRLKNIDETLKGIGSKIDAVLQLVGQLPDIEKRFISLENFKTATLKRHSDEDTRYDQRKGFFNFFTAGLMPKILSGALLVVVGFWMGESQDVPKDTAQQKYIKLLEAKMITVEKKL